MKRGRHLTAALTGLLILAGLVVAGCSEKQDDGGAPAGPETTSVGAPGGGGGPAGGPGGPGGPGGGPGGGGAISATATAAEIYSQKCQGCHGAGGSGGTAPSLTSMGDHSEDDIKGVIQNGKGQMPAQGAGLSPEQIDAVAKYVKGLGAKSSS